MKEELYGKKISLEKKLDLYNKLNDILSDAYPFFEGESETLEQMYDIISSKIEKLNKQYINLMNNHAKL